jgi:tetratricopeptide (TPR) repeat protein
MRFVEQLFSHKDLETWIRHGLESIQRRDYAQALAAYNRALRLAASPEQKVSVYILRSSVHYVLGRYEDVVRDATKAIDLGVGDLAAAYANRAASRQHLGQLDLAIADCTQALTLDTRHTVAYFVRGSCLFSQQEYTSAARDLAYFRELATRGGSYDRTTVQMASGMLAECLERMEFPEKNETVQDGTQLVEFPEPEVHDIAKPARWHQFVPGDLIKDRYRVLRILGGGMGIVYIAADLSAGQMRAIKTFRREYLEDDRAKTRFEAEARTWIALDKHPNIVQARWFERIDGVPYIFVEYVDGMSLRDWICQETRKTEHVLDLALQLCDGMMYAGDRKQLIHRDLKPENILINKDGVLKVTDFGLAKVLDSVQPQGLDHLESAASGSDWVLTRGGVGTPSYMAPEQFDDARNVDVTADVYAFGVILYEMLAGRRPFEGATWQEYERHHKQAEPSHLTNLDAAISSKLNEIISRCLAKVPSERYQSFHDLQAELLPLYETVTGRAYCARGESEPLTAPEWTDKGSYLSSLGHLDQALACYDRALELDPTFHIAYGNKGQDLARLGKDEQAIACYREALSIEPDFHFARARLGEALADIERYDEALETFDRLIQRWPASPIGWAGKARSLRALGRSDEAMTYYDQALARIDGPVPEESDRDEFLAALWYNRGNCCRRLGDQHEALRSYEQCLTVDPYQAGAWFNKGNTLLDLDRLSEAIDAYGQAIALYPNYEKAWVNKGRALARVNQPDAALECYDHVLSINPELTVAYFNKGGLLYERGEYSEALAALEQVTRLEPGNAEVWQARAACLETMGQKEEAEVSRYRGLELEPPTGPLGDAVAGKFVLVTPDANPDVRAFLASVSGVPTCHFCHKRLPGKPPQGPMVLTTRADQIRLAEESQTVPKVCLECRLVVCSTCAYDAAKAIGASEFVCPNCHGPVAS